mmetsp:Transcript_35541/g.100605  ORF Transcript_35541/g.100605 Transcript_35541/m.100605 type:complete len:358 (+) Transcript_35541:258-1331(+)|eukprot:CAMPEP_0117648178 /NCGR_PEP_ID=MMETSP0804-20121206/252_1 /TAXON_ID=1074897 /ORGANISM="Tetraselmis astigmatica, Strain CCMP880" /LENGTH=357 /DNA_ID=CAMNT_0005453735 /DNA_START=244 /DNA_END=1317 /DNA_ORIENTATION=+
MPAFRLSVVLPTNAPLLRASSGIHDAHRAGRIVIAHAAKSDGGISTIRSPFLNGPADSTKTHLDPELPGFKNWDPLRLADASKYSPDEEVMNIKWLSYAELIHGRWAMLGAAGAVAPEFLGRWGVIPPETALPWFEAGGLFPEAGAGLGAIPFLNVQEFDYWVNAPTLAWTMVVLMGFAEGRRWMDYVNPGSQGRQYFLGLEAVLGGSGDPKYPGGPFFNLFGLGSTQAEKLKDLKSKEINNGRLAMVAMAGMGMQANVTRVGPVKNLCDIFFSDEATTTIVDMPNFGILSAYLVVFLGLGGLILYCFGQEEQTMRRLQEEQQAAAERELEQKRQVEAEAAKATEEQQLQSAEVTPK